MNKISPRTLDLIRRIVGNKTADLAAQAEAIPIFCDTLEDIVQAARQEGARDALGDGPATLLDELAMAALPHALSRARADVDRYGDRISPPDHVPDATREAYRIARSMMAERNR